MGWSILLNHLNLHKYVGMLDLSPFVATLLQVHAIHRLHYYYRARDELMRKVENVIG